MDRVFRHRERIGTARDPGLRKRFGPRTIPAVTEDDPERVRKTPAITQEIEILDLGEIDGVVGRQTLVAVRDHQDAKDLAAVGLTSATLRSLGVAPRIGSELCGASRTFRSPSQQRRTAGNAMGPGGREPDSKARCGSARGGQSSRASG